MTGLTWNGFAQTEIESEALTIEDGLSQGFVSAILQDREGFLWFSTKNGLNRYDGRQFKEFTKNAKDPFSISNNWVTSIVEEGDFLVIGTYGTFLNLFHKKTHQFHRIQLAVEGVELFNNIGAIHVDTAGHYWITAEKPDQLLRVVFPENFWVNYPQDTRLIEAIQVDQVVQGYRYHSTSNDPDQIIIQDHKGNIKKLHLRSLKINAADQYSPATQFSFFKQIAPNLGLAAINNSNYYYNLCRKRDGIWEIIPTDFSFKKNSYFDESSNRVWLQRTKDHKLIAFDLDQLLTLQKIKELSADYVVDNINTTALSFYQDQSGILWVGTNGLGVRKISPRKLVIKNYLPGVSINKHVYTLWDGDLLLPLTKSSSSHDNIVNQFISQGTSHKVAWLEDGKEQGWLSVINLNGSSGLEFELYHFQEGRFQEMLSIPFSSTLASEISMLRALDKKLYIYFSNYFIQYDPNTNFSQVFPLDLFKNYTPIYFYMTQTANGDVWIGTSKGLIRGQLKNGDIKFEIVEATQGEVCASVLIDPKDANILWIGTKGSGLARLDTRTMELAFLNTDNGLPNDVIYGVLNDEAGNLWLSSNRGIIAYHPQSGDIRNYTSADGLQSNEFNTYAFGRGLNGALLFGGINGLNEFQPSELKDNPFRPEVRITQLAINNQAVQIQDSTQILERAIESTKSITLDYSNNNVSLTFAALEFTTPSKNTFSYYLEGAENEWVHTTTENQASYLNLDPGNYTFKIKAANGDMVWSDQMTILAITILPPWYRSSLAYLCYGILLGLAFWFYHRSQRNRLELKYKLESEKEEAERLKELESFRSKLYTNITHEFRTPLTVILGTSEKLEAQKHQDHPERKSLSLIRRSGKNLLNLVNQILDLTKIEHNKLEINYQQGDILLYLRYITESFHAVANANNILLKLESKQFEIWMDYDIEKIRQIISNLLSNAIKYTPSGGKVLLNIEQQDQQLYIKVSDSGKGIPAVHLPYVFDRFYQVENDVAKAGGSGIGLSLTRELVNLLGGQISVDSEVNKGTVFSLYLPIKRQARIEEFIPLHHDEKDQEIFLAEKENGEQAEQFPSLLIIEDNLDVVEYFTLCLEAQFELTFAYNGQVGIEKAFEFTPDLIISDVMMPEKTGFEVTETLKQDERTSHIPIVLLTAKADLESRLEGLKLGADVYLPKPFYREELIAILENLLKLRKQLQTKYSDLTQVESLVQPTDNTEAHAQDKEDAFLKKIRAIVEKDLSDNEIGNLQLIRGLGMSKSQIYKKVKALTGKSPSRYIRSIRLHHAKKLLETGNENVSEIAYQVGFTSLNYFSDTYHEEFGVRPSETRKSL